jgi:glycerol uptake facilitator-like aquaporin
VAIVIGSGIAGRDLAGDDVAMALLANTLATGTGLLALIVAFAPVSGAHFNPVITAVDAAIDGGSWRRVPAYVAAQIAGAIAGAMLAHAMFERPLIDASTVVRSGHGRLIGEAVATFGLVAVVIAVGRRKVALVPVAVATWITAAYWFTSSTSFANPAVTVGRALTDSFAGIRPVDAPGFIAAQVAGGALAAVLVGWLVPRTAEAR